MEAQQQSLNYNVDSMLRTDFFYSFSRSFAAGGLLFCVSLEFFASATHSYFSVISPGRVAHLSIFFLLVLSSLPTSTFFLP